MLSPGGINRNNFSHIFLLGLEEVRGELGTRFRIYLITVKIVTVLALNYVTMHCLKESLLLLAVNLFYPDL